MSSPAAPALSRRPNARADYLSLTKPRITAMVVFTAALGYIVASPRGGVDALALFAALVGTALVSAGASAANMLIERHSDARMQRTRDRPLPGGRLHPPAVAGFAVMLTLAGLIVLATCSGALAAGVALVTWVSYVMLYTPLKAHSSLSTLVGAVPGALPPVIGWAAARQAIEPGAGLLFAIVFLWQIPHFLAIAWMFKDDYARGGLPMLPVIDSAGHMTGRQAVAHALALFVVSLAPAAVGLAGSTAFFGAVLLGLGLTAAALRLALRRDRHAARQLFFASLVYLPALCLLLLFDRQG